MTPSPAAFDRLRQRIQALRAKTVANGCTEGEALAAAAKVAELLDRYDLSLTDVEIRRSSCEQLVYQVRRNKRIPLDECIGVIADFCDCRVWREKDRSGDVRWVFFGLRADIEAAHCLAEMIDSTVRTELGRYKTSVAYQAFRHQERHLANASFTLGMVASIADKLLVVSVTAMLLAFDRIAGVAVLGAVVILCRELLVSGLREVLADIRLKVPVSKLAKWKTVVQMVAIGFLLAGSAGDKIWPYTTQFGLTLLWIAAILTLYTGYDYLLATVRHVITDEES